MAIETAQARLFFGPGELNDLWAAVMYGAALAPSLDGFTERRLVEVHGKIAAYARLRAGGFEFATYPGDRRLLAQMGAAAPRKPTDEADQELLRLLIEHPALLGLNPDVEGLALSRRDRARKYE